MTTTTTASPDREQTESLGHPVDNEDDLRIVTLRVHGYDPRGTVELRHGLGRGKIRVYMQEEDKYGHLRLVPIAVWPHTWGPGTFVDDTKVRVEGFATSTAPQDVAMMLRYYPPGGGVCVDQIKMTVVESKLDVARLTGVVVPEDVEAFEGSITKIVTAGLDDNPSLWHLTLPECQVKPFINNPCVTITLEKGSPPNNGGQFRVLRDGVPYLDESAGTIDVPWSDITAAWTVEAVGAGAMDLRLIAKAGGRELHRDCVRVYGVLISPASGANHIVSTSGQLNAEGRVSHSTIAAALAAAASNDNVVIGRGTHSENALSVPQGAYVVGLGGALDPSLQHLLNPINMPVVDGTLTNTVFQLSGYTSGPTRLAGLEIVAGKASLGAGIRVSGCTANVFICFNHITSNIGFPAPSNGGGIAIEQSSPVIVMHNVIEENSAQAYADEGGGGGGGIFILDPGDDVIVHHNLLRSNTADYGGAIGCRGSQALSASGSATILYNSLENNAASTAGGAIAVVGMNDDHLALTAGGKIHGPRGVIGGLPTIVEHNVAKSDSATGQGEARGGGIYNGAGLSIMTLVDNLITQNLSHGDGSGISTFNAAFTDGLDNVITYNGPSGNDGGGIDHGARGCGRWQNTRVELNSCENNGGAVHGSVAAEFTSQGNTFLNNVATNGTGGGIYLRNADFFSQGGNVIGRNRALANHGGGMAIFSQDDDTLSPSPIVELVSGDHLHDNTAAGRGGAVYMAERSSWCGSTINFNGAAFDANVADAQVLGRSTSAIYATYATDSVPIVFFELRDNSFSNHAGAAVSEVNLSCQNSCNIYENSFGSNQIGILLLAGQASIAENEFSGSLVAHVRLEQVENTAITHNQFNSLGSTVCGIWIDRSDYGGDLEIHGNNYVGHTGPSTWAIMVATPSIGPLGGWYFVDAEGNWWNHASGPDDAPPLCLDGDCNTNPGADKVSDAVDFRPWSTARN